MKLGLNIGMLTGEVDGLATLVRRADQIGIDSVWASEAWGADAVTVLAYLAGQTEHIKLATGIMQIPGRTPANTAMTAMALDLLSGGRTILGLGLSGPQVVEGWHGVPYGKPLARTREYVDIIRAIVARDEPGVYEGGGYQGPYAGPGASGLGKPLKSMLHPVRTEIPIYLAALGPKNVRQTAEIADGWLPIFYSPEREEIFNTHLDAGLEAAGRSRDSLAIAPWVNMAVGDDLDDCRDRLRPQLALYIGGMGARGKNFYNDLACRYGFEEAAATIQDLYLDGKKAEAAAAVPDALVDETALVGPVDRIIDRLQAWKESRVDTLILSTDDPQVLERLQNAL